MIATRSLFIACVLFALCSMAPAYGSGKGTAGARAGTSKADAAKNIMTREKYADYMKLFNARDERFAGYYDPNVRFNHGNTGGILQGPQAIVQYYRIAWKELKEKISAGEVVIDNEHGLMAVELTTDLLATSDVVSVPGIHMKKGDHLDLKQVIIYGLSNGKIIWVRAGITGRTLETADSAQATPLPQSMAPLTPEVQARFEEGYRKYLDCFNRRDIDCYSGFYNDDVVFVSSVLPRMNSKAEIVAFYQNVWQYLNEHITIRSFTFEHDRVIVDLENTLDVFKDFPDFPTHPMKKGDHRVVDGKVSYELRNGRFSRIADRVD